MRLILVDKNPLMVAEWLRSFAGIPGVEIHYGDIFDHPAAGIVSPANSFGIMDGGIDALYTRRFGPEPGMWLREQIARDHHGELLVGQAVSVSTIDEAFPTLIAAPTMRAPMRILDPAAVRLATRAAVREAYALELPSLAMPGMGTGTGRMREEWAARMMRAGYEDAVLSRPMPATIEAALREHYAPYPDGAREAALAENRLERKELDGNPPAEAKPAAA